MPADLDCYQTDVFLSLNCQGSIWITESAGKRGKSNKKYKSSRLVYHENAKENQIQ